MVIMKCIQHLFNNAMMKMNYHGWSLNIKPGHDSYCWIGSHRIDLGIAYTGDIRQILLHEIAHIGTARFCNQKHNSQFWKHLEDLIWYWLKQPLDTNQLRHKQSTGDGIYAICYDHSIVHKGELEIT